MIFDFHVRNFALLEDVEVRFFPGLNVFSGETGSGKSILFEALGVCLGERANRSMIRTGTQHAILEARFSMNEAILTKLREKGIDPDETLVIRRDLFTDFPSVARVNGSTVTIADLKYIAQEVCDIYGQYEHQLLLNPQQYLPLMDAYGDEEHQALLQQVQGQYHELVKAKRHLEEITQKSENLDREIDYIEFQVQEIDAAHLRDGEYEELFQEIHRLSNHKHIQETLHGIRDALQEEGEAGRSVVGGLHFICAALEHIKEYGEVYANMLNRAREAMFEMEDLSRDIGEICEGDTADLSRLDACNLRMAVITSLQKKYRMDIPRLMVYRDELEGELHGLRNIEQRRREADDLLVHATSVYTDSAQRLHDARVLIAKRLECLLTQELQEFAMGDVLLSIVFSKTSYGPTGFDTVEWMASMNKGGALQPIRQVISGGEMSRFMLALKKISMDASSDKLFVFDEIDAGLSGKAANAVGKRLAELADHRQVCIISHLPQMVSKADHHFMISKEEVDGRMITRIRLLDMTERQQEVARLLSGDAITETTLNNARALIDENAR